MNKQSAILLSLRAEGRKDTVIHRLLSALFGMMFYLSGVGMSELRYIILAGAVRVMQIAQAGRGLESGVTKNKGPESFLDVRGREVRNGAT
jgi:hypothetical protein